jgi:atrial natriuretic peptide receptor A
LSELISINLKGFPASQKGDVYSFAIILEEIVMRGGPYESVRQYMPVKMILDRVMAHENPPFRPIVNDHDCPPDLFELIEKCWSEIPEERPTFPQIRTQIFTRYDTMKKLKFY